MLTRTTTRAANPQHRNPTSSVSFRCSSRYCCFRGYNGISPRLFADTTRDHPSFEPRARSWQCLCPILCIVDTVCHDCTPSCVEFESITNLSFSLSVTPSRSHPPSTHPWSLVFPSAMYEPVLTLFPTWSRESSGGREKGRLFIGIRSRTSGSLKTHLHRAPSRRDRK